MSLSSWILRISSRPLKPDSRPLLAWNSSSATLAFAMTMRQPESSLRWMRDVRRPSTRTDVSGTMTEGAREREGEGEGLPFFGGDTLSYGSARG